MSAETIAKELSDLSLSPARAETLHEVNVVVGDKHLLQIYGRHDGDFRACLANLDQFAHHFDRLFEEKVEAYLEKINPTPFEMVLEVDGSATGVDGLLLLFKRIHTGEPLALIPKGASYGGTHHKKFYYMVDIQKHTIKMNANVMERFYGEMWQGKTFTIDEVCRGEANSLPAALDLLVRDLDKDNVLVMYQNIIDNGDATADTETLIYAP